MLSVSDKSESVNECTHNEKYNSIFQGFAGSADELIRQSSDVSAFVAEYGTIIQNCTCVFVS